MSLSEQYLVGCVDHFNPEEVLKVPQVLHLKCTQQLELYSADFKISGPMTTRSSTYNNMHTEPFGPFWMNKEESDFENSNPILRNRCVILEFQDLVACLRP